MSVKSKGPFEGVMVVEIGQYVVAPVAAMHMAQGGARVIKVEPVNGDNYRQSGEIVPKESRHYIVKNRGKESVCLALGSQAGDEVVRRLVHRADVVLVGMSPSAMARHGLDYESVQAVNPRVVYGSVAGFGHVGPESGYSGMDVAAQARSGLALALGAESNGMPLHSEVQVADYTTSLLLFAGVVTALYARERHGMGQKVDVSLLAGALYQQGNALHHLFDYDCWRTQFVEDILPELRKQGATPTEIARARDQIRPDGGIRRIAYRVIRTADGSVAVGAANSRLRRRLYELAGLPDDDDEEKDVENRVRLDEIFLKQPSSYWENQLRGARIPVARVRHVEEMLFDEHVLAEDIVVDVDHDLIGRYRTFGSPFRLSDTPVLSHDPSPTYAQHTRSVLRELGYDDEEIARMAAQRVIAVDESSDR